jgi:hypothetical protein
VDLRPKLRSFGLTPLKQGGRGTCSAFTMTVAIEFAMAVREGHTPRLSVEFLNWAANRTCGDNADGGFFADLWLGFAAQGLCNAVEMPYRPEFDQTANPTPTALADAGTRKDAGLQIHWIKEWNVRTGLTDEQSLAIARTLARGWPVCAGLRWPKEERWVDDVLEECPPDQVRDGHSVLFFGYREAASPPGHGVFLFRNTGGDGRDGSMTFAYACEYLNDAAWIDMSGSARGSSQTEEPSAALPAAAP